MEDLEAQQPIIDPSWTIISRVVAIDDPNGPEYIKRKRATTAPDTRYLIKWMGLPYQGCSWEKASDVLHREDFQAALETFEELGPISDGIETPEYKRVSALVP